MNDASKQILRQIYQKKRKNQDSAAQYSASQQIIKHIQALNVYQSAQRIAFYRAVHGEVDLTALWKLAEQSNKICYFPTITTKNTLSFLPATAETLYQKNCFGILEPVVEKEHAISPHRIDLLIIPLVAFDSHGTRLGMGCGYYDKTLAKHQPKLLMGVAYDFQYQTFIQPDPWDIPLDVIITPSKTYWSKP